MPCRWQISNKSIPTMFQFCNKVVLYKKSQNLFGKYCYTKKHLNTEIFLCSEFLSPVPQGLVGSFKFNRKKVFALQTNLRCKFLLVILLYHWIGVSNENGTSFLAPERPIAAMHQSRINWNFDFTNLIGVCWIIN